MPSPSPVRIALVAGLALLLAACAGGPVRRVSKPAAQIQQMTVRADGSWDMQLRLQNYSSIPMRFDRVRLSLTVGEQAAGDVVAAPALDIGPESADVVDVHFQPSTGAKLAVADALASSRGVDYAFRGEVAATPREKSPQTFQIDARGMLSPAPGLSGVLR